MTVEPFRVRASVERIKTISQSLRNLATGIGADVVDRHREISARYDYMSPEALAQIVRAETDLVVRQQTDRAEQQAIPLVTDLGVHIRFVREAADDARPKRDTSDTAAILLTKEKWDAVLAALGTGRYFVEIIRRADVSTLVAIEAFAPDYVRLNGIRRPTAEEEDLTVDETVQRITEAVTRRIIEVAADDVAEILNLARQAEGWYEVAFVWVELLRRKFAGVVDVDILEGTVTEAYVLRNHGLVDTPAEQNAQRNAALGSAASAEFVTYSGRL